ncbi:MAG TPA: APC family permease [Candidatus Limnocylindrales bacterium]|nr:APC family permease [Candidatus Limnocylindrales bacterium]
MSDSGRTLFTRQSSGLVREVSVVNALFFNTAAFIGGTLGGAYGIAVLAGVPVVVIGGLTNWSWVAFLVGAACVLLALIFASLTSVMPRSGGDYVFTSRIVPKIGPFLGWMESWMLAFASIALIQFETALTLRGVQMEGRIIGIGTGSSFFTGANSWFTEGSSGDITGVPGMIAGLVVIALIALVVLQPTRRFHKIVTYLTVFGIAGWALMAIFGVIFFDSGTFATNLPIYANGVTVDQLSSAASTAGLTSGFSFGPVSLTSWPLMLMASAMLFQFIGFQYSAYISGEVRGNVKRGILIAVLGALAMAVLMNSLYPDILARKLGLDGQTGWSAAFWGYITNPSLPMGQPNYFQLVGAIARPDLWPIWTVVGAASTLFPFLLMPVYVIFISRMALAWSLDRQVPEWLGTVSERLRAPANAIFATLAMAVIFLLFSNFSILKSIGLGGLAPSADPALDGKLNLVASAWFTILASSLSWILPGINAVLARFTRPDLVKDAPWIRWLPLIGVVWLVFAVTLYWFAGVSPILNTVSGSENPLQYLNSSGVSFVGIVIVVGIVIYLVQAMRNRRKGIETSLMYQMLPPD